MKQYMVKIRERKQERFRFPVALHLIQAVGALTLHTGVGTISYIARAMDIKNARSKVIWRAILACIKCNALQMYVFVLEWQKKKRKLFMVPAFSISIMLIIEHSKRTTKDIYLLSWGDKKNSFS